MKKCKQGYYYCYKDKKCKKIPLGYRIGLGGWLRKEKDEETEEKKKNGNGNGANGNGNGNGESNGGSNGGGVSEAWSSKYKKSIDCDNPKGFSQRAHCRGRKKVSEEAVSRKQQKFFGIVRAIQKGELEPTTPETAKAARDMKKSDVKKFASTKHKGLPEKKEVKEESNPRIPRKKGQPANSKKHSDLYTDENPKGTIHGLGFKNVATAKASVAKIKKSSRSHAHKIQAAVAMEQRAREMGKTSEAAVYRKFINSMKKKTKAMNEETCPICGCDPCQCLEGGITEARDGKSSKDKGYSLRDWFKGGGWKQTGGKYDGKPCAKQPGQKTKPYCRDADDRAAMSKEERNKRARKKRKEDPNPNRKGKAKNVTQESYSDWRKDFEISEQSGYGVITVGNQTVRIGNQPSRPSMPVRTSMPSRPSVPSPSVSQPVSRPMPTSTSSSTAITSANNTRLRQAQQDARDVGRMTGTSDLMNKTINTANRTQSRYDMLRQVMRQAGMKGADQNMNLRGVPMRNSYEPEGEVVEGYDEIRPYDRIKMGDGKLRTIKDIDAKLKEKKPVQKNSFEPQGQVIPEDAFDPNFVDRKRREQDRPKDKVAQPPAEKFIDTRPPADFRDKVPNTNSMGPGTSGGRNSMGPGTSGGRNTNSIKAKPLATLNRGKKGDGFLGPTISAGGYRIGIPNPIRKEEVEAVEEGKKDACYHKVKSRYSVWPSAYASGALVKCRKVGAKNWGNKTKKESVDYSNWRDDFQALEIETIDLIKADPIEVPPSRIDIIKEGAKKRNQTLDEVNAVQAIRLGLAAGTAIGGAMLGKGAIDSVQRMADKKKKQLDDAKGLSNSYEPEGEALDEKCWKGYEKKGMKTMFGKRYPNCVKKKKTRKEEVDLGEMKNGGDNDPCWDTHKQVGMKKKGGKMVPNCVPKNEEYSNWRDELEEGAAWTKKEGKNKSGGLNEKGRKSYERENPGSDLKRPSKKVGNKRRKSFCARMKGMKKKLTSKKTANDPDSRINKSLRAWNC